MKKECKSCKVEKSMAEFIKQGGYRHPQCDDCRRADMRERHHKRQTLRKAGVMWNE